MSRTVTWLKSLALLAVVATVIAIPSVVAAQGKIAVIDLRRAVIETEDGLRVQAKLKELFDSRQTELEVKEKAFAEAKAAFDKDAQSGKIAERELQGKYEALAKQQIELQQLVALYRREMQQRESELMNPIVQRLLALVQRLSAQQGYDMVLNKEAVSFVRRDLDVTDRIIQMYNSTLAAKDKPKDGKTPKKPAAPPSKKR